MSTNKLGVWLERQLQERGWTQRQAAEHTGIKRSTLNLIMRSDTKPGWDILIHIAEAFDQPLWFILELAGLDLQLPPTTDVILRRIQSKAEEQPEYAQLLELLGSAEPEDVRALLSLLLGARQMRERAEARHEDQAGSKMNHLQ